MLPLIATYRLSSVCICENSKLSSSFSPSAANKYCPLLIKEGGIRLLEKVLELESSQPETKDMARYHRVLSSPCKLVRRKKSSMLRSIYLRGSELGGHL